MAKYRKQKSRRQAQRNRAVSRRVARLQQECGLGGSAGFIRSWKGNSSEESLFERVIRLESLLDSSREDYRRLKEQAREDNRLLREQLKEDYRILREQLNAENVLLTERLKQVDAFSSKINGVLLTFLAALVTTAIASTIYLLP